MAKHFLRIYQLSRSVGKPVQSSRAEGGVKVWSARLGIKGVVDAVVRSAGSGTRTILELKTGKPYAGHLGQVKRLANFKGVAPGREDVSEIISATHFALRS